MRARRGAWGRAWLEGHPNRIEHAIGELKVPVWSLLKRSIRGTHVHVSPKHLTKYLGEFEQEFLTSKPIKVYHPSWSASFSVWG